MHNYYIESFKITKLWGYRDIDLHFNSDVNILIGPNGSGKTTVLNLLHSILTADISNITNIKFDQAEIKLRSFKGKSNRTLKVYIEEDLLKLKLGQKVYPFDIDSLSRGSYRQVFYFDDSFDDSGRIIRQPKGIDEIMNLVPLVWLPVNRRLPVTEDEERRYSRRKPLESVDIRLNDPDPGYKLEDILVLPLISRTKDMVKYARELEEDREDIFAPLHHYEKTVNSFLEDKTIKVDESSDLRIKLSSKSEL